MAEPVNANSAAPKPTAKKKGPNPILESIASFLKITTWLSVGMVFLFLGVICKIKRPIPTAWEPFFTHHIPHLPYFVCGFGFLCLGYARSILRGEYETEQKKDIFYPHAWKVSLLGTQVFLLYLTGIYGIFYGVNLFFPALGMLGLVFFIACFFVYLLWYLVEYFKNRLPAFASLRIAVLAFVFAGISYGCWTFYQMIIPSLMLAFLAICAGIYSLNYSGTVKQRGSWIKYLFMTATVVLLAVVGYYVLDLWKPQAEPLNTVVVAKGLRGDISNLVYSPQGDKIIFTQNFNHQWFLQLVSPDQKAPVTIKLPSVDDSFRTVFVENGKSLLIDGPKEGKRSLLKVNVDNGTVETLVKADVQPFSGGLAWNKVTQQFLYVTKDKKGYDLNVWSPGKKKFLLLYSSTTAILSPSWVDSNEVVFVDGIHSTPYLLNIRTKEAEPIITEDDKKEQDELVENDPLVEVVPSPDNFRYLCVGQKNGQTTFWTMLMNGTKRVEIYKTNDQLSDINWMADAQKIVAERNGLRKGFKHDIKGIVIINANLRTAEDLVPAQINSHSPATSPDGIKIAFVASEGLWYPSLDSGIWVAVLR